MKYCLSMEPMCHWHILRKRQTMPATGSFKSGKAEADPLILAVAGDSMMV